jgi:hypothetical protein
MRFCRTAHWSLRTSSLPLAQWSPGRLEGPWLIFRDDRASARLRSPSPPEGELAPLLSVFAPDPPSPWVSSVCPPVETRACQ